MEGKPLKKVPRLTKRLSKYCPETNWQIPELLEKRQKDWERLLAGAQEALDWLESHGKYSVTTTFGTSSKAFSSFGASVPAPAPSPAAGLWSPPPP